MTDAADSLFSLAEAAAAWHVDPATAMSWINAGRVRAVTDTAGAQWVPLGEVARMQTVLGQNRQLPRLP